MVSERTQTAAQTRPESGFEMVKIESFYVPSRGAQRQTAQKSFSAATGSGHSEACPNNDVARNNLRGDVLVRYPRRLRKKTACSPNKFQNHHGMFSRSGLPQALKATDFSIRAPMSRHRPRKSLIVQ